MNRSSCASGSGYVPSCSSGFWVASTKNGRSSGYVSPAAVTRCSCMASSRAAWVFGGVRLISSASRMFVKIGPLMKRYSLCPLDSSTSRISVPVMSEGMRSGVNWMRRNCRSSTSATVRIIIVFARPGMPIIRTCPLEMIAVNSSDTISFCPMIALEISALRRSVFTLISRTVARIFSSSGVGGRVRKSGVFAAMPGETESSKTKTASPIVIVSPFFSGLSLTRVPFNSVPLRLPRSLTCQMLRAL